MFRGQGSIYPVIFGYGKAWIEPISQLSGVGDVLVRFCTYGYGIGHAGAIALLLEEAKNGPSVVKRPGKTDSVETSGLSSRKEARFSLGQENEGSTTLRRTVTSVRSC